MWNLTWEIWMKLTTYLSRQAFQLNRTAFSHALCNALFWENFIWSLDQRSNNKCTKRNNNDRTQSAPCNCSHNSRGNLRCCYEPVFDRDLILFTKKTNFLGNGQLQGKGGRGGYHDVHGNATCQLIVERYICFPILVQSIFHDIITAFSRGRSLPFSWPSFRCLEQLRVDPCPWLGPCG